MINGGKVTPACGQNRRAGPQQDRSLTHGNCIFSAPIFLLKQANVERIYLKQNDVYKKLMEVM
jgi:hypothetical protein